MFESEKQPIRRKQKIPPAEREDWKPEKLVHYSDKGDHGARHDFYESLRGITGKSYPTEDTVHDIFDARAYKQRKNEEW